MAGTTATLTYYGVKLISPQWFYLASAVICGLISISIGSSWTTVGTIGVALIAISSVLGLNPAITAGAVISGGYFGDKMSPLSDTTNLSPAIAGTDLYTHIRAMLVTTVPSILLALGLYAFIGLRTETAAHVRSCAGAGCARSQLQHFTADVAAAGRRAVHGDKTHAGVCGHHVWRAAGRRDGRDSCSLQLVIAFANDPTLSTPLAMLKGVWSALANGFEISTGYPSIDTLVSRGGMSSMLTTVWLVISAMSFGAIMDYTGSLRKLLEPLVRFAKTAGRLMISVGVTAIFLNIFAGDQYMALVLPGTIFKDEFKKRRIAPEMLSRQMEDTATITSPLVPWNTCGAYMAATLGVATIAYLPFCFFNIINPILSFVFDAIGFKIKLIPAEKAAEVYAPAPAEIDQYGVSGYAGSKL